MTASSGVKTFLFTDIEGSTRLWETAPDKMQPALARHDAIAHEVVARHNGTLVKMTGDGLHAVFDDPLDAVCAATSMQQDITTANAAGTIELRVRCGIHAGVGERRDGDFYGSAINRAARIMSAAHGGQILVSDAVATLVAGRLAGDWSLRDLGNVRLRDFASAERIHQVVHPALRAQFPALRSLEAVPNNLPQQLTSFVGRERELREVTALVGAQRLVTLTGPGGIGKTRLSLQAAAEVMDAFEDGVYLIEFAPVSDKRMVPQAVASALGVKEDADTAVVDALTRHMASRRMLLVFDNCEHLVDGCAALAHALLRASAGVHILASSREALRVEGEHVYPVPSLSLPAGNGAAAGSAATSEAVQLFVERAVAARPAFALGQDNAPAVAEICRQLDGIALAIELAAACTRTMAVTRIAERLGDRFRLLTGGARNALPRQKTLRTLIDWSYDLLDDRERSLLRRLAVFAGGFSADAVAHVAGDTGLSRTEVEDALGALVDKSLVGHDLDSDRYALLETVRQYALEKLAEGGDEAPARARHLAFFLQFAESARDHLFGSEQRRWLKALDADSENVLSALKYCDRSEGGCADGLRLVVAIKYYWFNRGLLELGLRVTLDALAREGAAKGSLDRADALRAAGQLASWRGAYFDATRYLQEALAIARAAGNTSMIAGILQPLGLAAIGLGKRREARAHLEEALDLARAEGDKREIAAALNQLAQLERIDGRTARAAEHFAHALELARDIGDAAVVAVTLINLAMVAIIRRAAGEVPKLLEETLAIAVDNGDRLAGLSALDVCTALAALRNEGEHAARFHGMAGAQLYALGATRDPVDSAFLVPWLGEAESMVGKEAFDVAVREGRARNFSQAMTAAREWIARAA